MRRSLSVKNSSETQSWEAGGGTNFSEFSLHELQVGSHSKNLRKSPRASGKGRGKEPF